MNELLRLWFGLFIQTQRSAVKERRLSVSAVDILVAPAFAVTPAVRPTSQTPEGWADVADQQIIDHPNLTHSWDMDALVRLEFETANPDLIPVLKAKPMRDPALVRSPEKPKPPEHDTKQSSSTNTMIGAVSRIDPKVDS